jgi:hypothetical protein
VKALPAASAGAHVSAIAPRRASVDDAARAVRNRPEGVAVLFKLA